MNKFDLKKKVAIVTGGAQGFGLDITKRFLKSGAKVIVWDNDENQLKKIVKKIKNKNLVKGYNFLKNKTIKSVMIAQREAIKKVFQKQGLKFRNFEIFNKDEESLGIIFTYFMLETILLGRLMKLNPFDQPAVESIKKETKKALS